MENCFRIDALVGEELSEFSNTVCINLDDEQPGSFLIWGYIYTASDNQDMISGAMIQAGNVMNGETYETVSDDTGYYELMVVPGEYIITGMIDYNILQQHHFILLNESDLRLDFWSGEFPDSYHLSGIIYGEASNGELVPLSFAEIMAAQNGIFLYTNANGGNYEMDLPFTGSWSVSVESDNFDILDQIIWIDGNLEQDFVLTPLEEFLPIWISVGSGSAAPVDTLEIPLFIENQELISEVSFTLTDDPQWLTAIEVILNLDCFNSLVNDNGYGVNVWLYSNGECLLEPGFHQFADIVFQIDDNAIFGQEINLVLESVSIIDEYENEMYTFVENGMIVLQLIGDINGDGDRNVLDVVQLVNYIILISEPDEYQSWAADLNEDETLDVLDIVILVNIILSGEG